MREEFTRLLEYWSLSNGKNLGLTGYEIALLEQTHKLKFPTDFKEYLSTICPASIEKYPEGIFDNNANLWWSFEKLKEPQDWHEESHGWAHPDRGGMWEGVFFFSDWGIECINYGVCCKPGENYAKIIADDCRNIYAKNIFDFINTQLIESEKKQFQSFAKTIRKITGEE